MKRKGLYIAFEGVVACGKSTQSKILQENLKSRFPEKEVIWTREPGGCEISEAIRVLVQGTPFKEQMDPICEAYLYASARAQSLHQVVLPVLNKDGIVVADRSYITSLAQQGARGIDVETLIKINEVATLNLTPDVIIYIQLPLDIAMARLVDKSGDKFESLGADFFQRVGQGYKEISKLPTFKNKWLTIDGSGTIEEVQQLIQQGIEPYINP